jgi:hypothetical protein
MTVVKVVAEKSPFEGGRGMTYSNYKTTTSTIVKEGIPLSGGVGVG